MGIVSKLLGILQPATELVDALHTSDSERLAAKEKLLQIQATVISEAIGYEQARLAAQSSVIVAEANSSSWITRSWRPITMLTFLALIVLHWFGVGPAELPEELWAVIKIGLGGYMGGRSLEKMVPAIVAAMKEAESA
jgi:hypothetical protein